VPVRQDVTTVEVLRATVATFRDLLRVHQEVINSLNVYPVPDGDTGTNMARTLDAVVAEVDDAPGELGPTCDAISHGAVMGARGNSGVIVSQILRGLASTCRHHEELSAAVAAAALTAASDAAYDAVLKPVEGTILTVVREGAAAATATAASGESLAETLRAARAAAGRALDDTPNLLPVLRDAGVVDAGGAGLLLLLDAAVHVVAGDPLPEPGELAPGTVAPPVHGGEGAGDVSDGDQRYEVMFLCHLADQRINELKVRWGDIGDSIVVVGGDGLWNCHVHTNDIGAAIETPLTLDGRPFQIRVTDLFDEVAHAAVHHGDHPVDVPPVKPVHHSAAEDVAAGAAGHLDDDVLPEVTCAVVAVSSGAGIATLFRQLGVQVVVAGGQTLNPSTAELLAAVERANARHVIVLPGNKNIIPVAEQVDALTDKTVRVIPTRSMPEGLAALMAYDPEIDAPANVLVMRHAAEAVVTAEVTRAVRAATTDAGSVAAGDWIGIVRGDGIVAVAPDVVGAATATLAHVIDDASELVTILTGADARAEDTAAIDAWLAERRGSVAREVHIGGQPLYPYLFGVE
jgi:DAK2 domain fusion protein YloV